MIVKFLTKIENGVETFVQVGEYGTIESWHSVKPINDSDFEYAMVELSKTEPVKMYGNGQEVLSLPHEIHRLTGISYEKPEAKFELRLVEVDFENNEFKVVKSWNYDVKQWDDNGTPGHVRITQNS